MIHFFCALDCEAETLIHYFKLTEIKQYNLFRLYQSSSKSISLTITGVGKLNAAAAICYHHACLQTSPPDCWINVGIAGHKHLQIGEVRLVHKITDAESRKTWYPQILFQAPCATASLTTLSRPSTGYQETLFDLEAAGFYEMAMRLGGAELIQVVKTVSDNKDHPASRINKNAVKKLILNNIGVIHNLVNLLEPFSSELKELEKQPSLFRSIINTFHFTRTEKIQLLSLLHHCSMRLPDRDLTKLIAADESGGNVLNSLRKLLKESGFVLYD